ncbi:MAG: hypothetical protein LBS23_02010 [Holosporaceae bacterium]|jgi:hypothetical protein|nr:hypothetical protein [Holosporaceae bacterium]
MEKKEKTIAMFHISGGGGNRNELSFVGFDPISECSDFETELYLRDDEGNIVDSFDEAEPHYEWTNSQGNGVGLTYEEYESGIGRIDIDGDYDTTYTVYVEDMDEDEFQAMVNPGRGFYYLDDELDSALVEYGFSEQEVALARAANDIDALTQCGRGSYKNDVYSSNYINDEYEVVNKEDEYDYKVGNIFYKKI